MSDTVRFGRLTVFLVLVLAVGAWPQTGQASQQESSQPQPAPQEAGQPQSGQLDSDAMDPTDQRAQVPLPVNTAAPSLAFSGEMERTNFLRGGISLGTSYDDNAFSSSTDRIGNFTFSVLPHIAWDQSTNRLRWTLDYAAGLMVNQRVSERNQGSHNLGIDLQYRLSPHVDVFVRDRFYTTTGLFSPIQDLPGGVLGQPNGSVFTPLAQQRSNTGTAGINYQFGAGSMIGASGSFFDSHYDNVAGSATLNNTQNIGASGFYTHRVSPRNWTGVTYKFQRLSFSQTGDKTVTHSVLLFHTIHLQPRMELSFFAGPEYSTLDTQTLTTVIQLPVVYLTATSVTSNSWSVSGGASFAWQGEHTSVRSNFVRKVSDGGGLLSAVQLNSVTGTVRRQLTRATAAVFGASYGVSDSLSFLSAGNSLTSASGSIVLERRLGKSLGLGLGYAREYQQQYGSASDLGEVNRNRGWVTVSYDFSRPLGR